MDMARAMATDMEQGTLDLAPDPGPPAEIQHESELLRQAAAREDRVAYARAPGEDRTDLLRRALAEVPAGRLRRVRRAGWELEERYFPPHADPRLVWRRKVALGPAADPGDPGDGEAVYLGVDERPEAARDSWSSVVVRCRIDARGAQAMRIVGPSAGTPAPEPGAGEPLPPPRNRLAELASWHAEDETDIGGRTGIEVALADALEWACGRMLRERPRVSRDPSWTATSPPTQSPAEEQESDSDGAPAGQ